MSNNATYPRDGDPLPVIQALQRCSVISYDAKVYLCDVNGNQIRELSVIKQDSTATSPPTVERDCTNETQGTFSFTTDESLVWGHDYVMPVLVVSSPQYLNGAQQEFQRGVYIATSPDKQLTLSNNTQARTVSCYDKIYLLRSDVGDTFSANAGTTYADNIATLMSMAGIAGAKVSGHLNVSVVNYPGSWSTKTIPTGADMIYPSDDSNNYTYIQIINELLKASGCRPLWTDEDGTFTISLEPGATGVPSVCTIYQSPPNPLDAVIVKDGNKITSDVWGIPNQLVFIQNGLTFDPTHTDGSDGQYVINNVPNTTHYHPPSDQTTIGRIIRSVQHINASGQADLITQSEKIYKDLFSQAEVFTQSIAPWPPFWHYPRFTYIDPALSRGGKRILEVQSWSMPLTGGEMRVTSNVVADS